MRRKVIFENYHADSKKLDLSNKDLTSSDVRDLVIPFLIEHPHIKILNLSHNQINDDGAIDLAKYSTLESLDLSHNEISERGAFALAGQTNIANLDLGHNDLSEKANQALFRRYKTEMPTDVVGLILSNLNAREMGLASLVSKTFNKAANSNVNWRRKFKMYFPGIFIKDETTVNWKEAFKSLYNKYFADWNNEQRKIIEAIFENNLEYIRTVQLSKMIQVLELLRGFKYSEIIFDKKNKEMNDYLYEKCLLQAVQFDVNVDLLQGAIICHRPLDVIKQLVDIRPSIHVIYFQKAYLSGREDLIAYLSEQNITNFELTITGESILHFLAKRGDEDLFKLFIEKGADPGLPSSDSSSRNGKMPFELFDRATIVRLVEAGHLNRALTNHQMLERLLTIFVKENDNENFTKVLQILSQGLDVEYYFTNYALLSAVSIANNEEMTQEILLMLDAKVVKGLNNIHLENVYKSAVANNNYMLVEYLLRSHPKLIANISSINKSVMNSKMLDLHLEVIDPNDKQMIVKLLSHFQDNIYTGEDQKKIISKLHQGNSPKMIKFNVSSRFTQMVRLNNEGMLEYFEILTSKQINQIRSGLKRGLQNSVILLPPEVGKLLSRIFASDKIMRGVGFETKNNVIIQTLLTQGRYEQFHIYMDTMKRCSPFKYKILMKRIIKDMAVLGESTMEVILERNPPITAGTIRYIRKNHPDLLLPLKKKMIKTYIDNCESQKNNAADCKLFPKLKQDKGFTKQKKLAYAKHVLAYLEDKSDAPDNQEKISKTGELGKIMRHIRR